MSQSKTKSGTKPSFIDQRWPVALLLAMATLGVYWPLTHCDFINFDDPIYITANPQVRAGLTWNGLVWAFHSCLLGNWHPLTWLSFMLDSQLFKGWAGGYHLTNLLLHTANTVLLFLLLRRLTQAHWRSALVAALFALHPLHVESVAWIAERKDVLSTFFGLLSLIFYARYAQRKSPDSQLSTLNYVLALAFFAFSLMSKPMLVTLPFVMLLLDYWPLGRFRPAPDASRLAPFLRLSAEKTPFLALSALFSAVAIWAQKSSGAIISLGHLPLTARINDALASYVQYLGNTFWPVGLALPYPQPEPWPTLWVGGAVVLLLGLCIAAGWQARRRPWFFTGWLWYLGALLPVIGLVKVGSQAMADRYTYVPLIGIFLILIWGAGELLVYWRVSKTLMSVVAISMLGLFAARTTQQLRYWRNSEVLFRHTIAVTQLDYVAYDCLACTLSDQGRTDEAIASFKQALQIAPEFPNAHNDLGTLLLAQGKIDEAAAHFRKALEGWPDYPDVLNNLGIVFAKQGNAGTAMDYFQRALRHKPDDPSICYNLGKALLDQGRYLEAIPQFRAALKFAPADPATHDKLGIALARQGQRDEAISELKEALRLKPDYEEPQTELRQLQVK